MLKHTDDDGDLSVFAGTNEILFACSGGHYWLLEAGMRSVQVERGRGTPTRQLSELVNEFGPEVQEALGLGF